MAENENTFVILQSLLTCVCVSERTRDRAAASTERKQKARDPKAPISIWNFEGRQRRQQATRAKHPQHQRIRVLNAKEWPNV